jgi:hypothetical protein
MRKARPATSPIHFDAPTTVKDDAKIEAIHNQETFTSFCTRAIRDAVQRSKAARANREAGEDAA